MFKILKWLIVLVCIYMAYQAGWFNTIFSYFSDSAENAKQEQVIENEDGSYTTVRYRNILDILTGK